MKTVKIPHYENNCVDKIKFGSSNRYLLVFMSEG